MRRPLTVGRATVQTSRFLHPNQSNRQREGPAAILNFMKQETLLPSHQWLDGAELLTKDKHISLFYKFLLLVETNKNKSLKGYNWGDLKRAVGNKIRINNSTHSSKKELNIPESIPKNSIYLNNTGSTAMCFIKSVRNAFAHNYIRYIPKKQLFEIYLPSKKKDTLRLHALLSFSNLKLIYDELEKQKNKK